MFLCLTHMCSAGRAGKADASPLRLLAAPGVRHVAWTADAIMRPVGSPRNRPVSSPPLLLNSSVPCLHTCLPQNTEFTIKLKQLEDDLLYKLSTAEGDMTGAGSRRGGRGRIAPAVVCPRVEQRAGRGPDGVRCCGCPPALPRLRRLA